MFCSNWSKPMHSNLVDWVQTYVEGITESITDDGHILLSQSLPKGETVEDRFYNACVAFSFNRSHATRLATYIKKGWFMFASPLLNNGGTSRGLPISCFVNQVGDSLKGLANHYTENIFLSTIGGGIGSDWSKIRSVGQVTSKGVESSGLIPFLKVADSQVPAFKQGETRSGAYAAYLDVSHPEIMEFLSVRSSDGGDFNRKCFNSNIAVVLSDSFMEAVMSDSDWNLIDSHSKEVVDTVKARDIWNEIIIKRIADRGQPYLFWKDVANRGSNYPSDFPYQINSSNLCTEIMLATGQDYTAVCCLSSVNLAKFDEWSYDPDFIADLVLMLNVALDVFMDKAPYELANAVSSTSTERSIGLGAMGLHTYIQSKGESFEDYDDSHLFKHIQRKAHQASRELIYTYGDTEYTQQIGMLNTHVTAIAPNASSSIMLGVSPGVEPYRTNTYSITQRGMMFSVFNPQLESLISNTTWSYHDADDVMKQVKRNGGSIQGLTMFTEEEKEVYKTFAEIDQSAIVLKARRRQKYIDQGQSINLCFEPGESPLAINKVHLAAWDKSINEPQLKSLYYLRTDIDTSIEDVSQFQEESIEVPSCDEDVCLVCQG